ncbi:PH domain-containing protein [Nocardioides sp.]|uniref:PH domain-containing protein n=1 Tax=Nocardioides sp. TaxID=35761 RepID=UPI002726587F|nr:PH domain-containing protein [Nocardioides sp.]MDO9456753.1 PH domain-containing protein [Nocardioides sp.]
MSPVSVVAAAHDWQRLDRRMLLVHPIRELVRFLPALVAIAVAGTASGGAPWQALGVVVPVALGVLRYLTTRYRIAAGRIELRRGLLSRRVTSTPLDRVRTVDLTSSVVQRVLGLTTLRIGTGLAANDEGDALDLDGLPVDRARALRADLLHAAPVASEDGWAGDVPAAPHDAVPLVAFDPRWLRFAPFTGTGLIVVAAVVGGASQLLESFDVWDDVRSDDLPVPSGLGIALGVVAGVVVLVALSVLGYLVTNGGFRLTREAGAWHVRRGLLTTRETSIDEERLAGVAIGEPLALRLTGGRHLQAIVTGVNRSQSGSSTLVPPSDADVAPAAARAILGQRGPDGPVDAPLTGHGPAATRRRWTRALLPAVVLLLLAVAAVATGAPWWLLVPCVVILAASAALAADRAAGLGHALVDGHLVARSGSLARRREMLDVDHVIGWTLRDTWFQRRAGLIALAATTAGGRGSVGLLDVPEADAVRLADEALPGLVSQFATVPRHGLNTL